MGVTEDLVDDHVLGSDPGDPVHARGRSGKVARNPGPEEHRSRDSVEELEKVEKGQAKVEEERNGARRRDSPCLARFRRER